MKPSYQASPRLPKRLLFATVGSGPPEVRDAEQRRLGGGQRRHVDVARHDEAARAQVLVAGREHQPRGDLAIDLELRLDAGAALDVGIDGRHARQRAGGVGRQHVGEARRARPGRTTAPRSGSSSRHAAARSRARAAAGDRGSGRRWRARPCVDRRAPTPHRARGDSVADVRLHGRGEPLQVVAQPGRSRSPTAPAATRPARRRRGSGSTATATTSPNACWKLM